MRRFFKSLFGQVVIALLAGIVVGLAFPHVGESLKPLGDAFIKLIKMIIPMALFMIPSLYLMIFGPVIAEFVAGH